VQKKNQFLKFFSIEMKILSAFWQEKGLGLFRDKGKDTYLEQPPCDGFI